MVGDFAPSTDLMDDEVVDEAAMTYKKLALF